LLQQLQIVTHNTSLYNCDHVIPAFPASCKPDMCNDKLHSQPP
jgi:hypothetical protein